MSLCSPRVTWLFLFLFYMHVCCLICVLRLADIVVSWNNLWSFGTLNKARSSRGGAGLPEFWVQRHSSM